MMRPRGGKINDPAAAGSVTVNALGANGLVLGSLTDTLSSTTLSYFNTSTLATFASTPGFTGYSLVGSGPTGTTNNYDFAGDDFTFTNPAPPPAPTYSGNFNFDTDSVGTSANPMSVQTTFSDTAGNVTATFSDPSANGSAFRINSKSSVGGPPNFTGNYLQPNAAPTSLSVAFSQTLLNGSLSFAQYGSSGTFTLTELLNGVAVGTATSSSQFGPLSFGGAAFNSLTLSDAGVDSPLAFGIDSLSVTNTAAPEPSEWALLGFAGIGIPALLLRARRRQGA